MREFAAAVVAATAGGGGSKAKTFSWLGIEEGGPPRAEKEKDQVTVPV